GDLGVQRPGRGGLPQAQAPAQVLVVQRVEVLDLLLALPQHLVAQAGAGHRARVLGVIPGPAEPARAPRGDHGNRDRHGEQRVRQPESARRYHLSRCPELGVLCVQGVSPSSWLMPADSDVSAAWAVVCAGDAFAPAGTAGGTPPPDGAFADPRTSTPLLAGSVQLALAFSGGPGEVSRP